MMDDLVDLYESISPKAKRELLNCVCENMLQRKAYAEIVKLIIEQLGENDAKEAIYSFKWK